MSPTLKRRLTDFPLGKQLRFLIGTALLQTRRFDADLIDAAPYSKDWSPFHRLLRNGLYYEALRKRDFTTLGRYLKDYWSVDAGLNFHEVFAHRFENHFLLRDVRLMPEIERLALSDPAYQSLCEIGCGNGMVLDYYRRHLPVFDHYIGLDLSHVEIEKNRIRHDASLKFHTADAVEWIANESTDGIVFLTNGGVFECFTPDELTSLLDQARKGGGPVAFAITENIATDHEIEIDRMSHVYAAEFSFSHNYPYLFRASGYRIRFMHETFVAGERWINLLAEYPGSQRPPSA
ncbi:class I SAM-dependent methyltransferase [Haloferula sp.]|uniref:class I SAM-dependent methyltransferase n=1 Tax=Haloferula sp. TaxID=2497595 RepID=UPI003C72917A